uniref:Ring finger domain protein n=1 Tax=Marseillevirus LCMAC103 TaxID=2506604 RepID=A0A481YV72_9VIRU|nr:MAG: ring finger domain protein [Marseillevirus LCMAC103]
MAGLVIVALLLKLAPIAIVTCIMALRRRRGARRADSPRTAPNRPKDELWTETISDALLAEIHTLGSGRVLCPICLDDFLLEARVVVLDCTHVFHSRCIEAHRNAKIGKSDACPICDRVLQERVSRTIDGTIDFVDGHFAAPP